MTQTPDAARDAVERERLIRRQRANAVSGKRVAHRLGRTILLYCGDCRFTYRPGQGCRCEPKRKP